MSQDNPIIGPAGLANLVGALRQDIPDTGDVKGKRRTRASAEAQHPMADERKQLAQTWLGIGGVRHSDPQLELAIAHRLAHLSPNVLPLHGHGVCRTALVGEREFADLDPGACAPNVGKGCTRPPYRGSTDEFSEIGGSAADQVCASAPTIDHERTDESRAGNRNRRPTNPRRPSDISEHERVIPVRPDVSDIEAQLGSDPG